MKLLEDFGIVQKQNKTVHNNLIISLAIIFFVSFCVSAIISNEIKFRFFRNRKI